LKPETKISLSIACICAVIGWLTGLSAFVDDVNSLPVPKPAQKLDAIVVLTGGSNRLDAGFNLLEQGFGKKLFISGVYRGLDVKRLLKRWKAEPQSNLDCCVVLGFEADNTSGNAVETAEWLHKEGFHSIYLVTANYHIRRALLEFGRLVPDVAVTPFPVVPDKSDIFLMAREYMKYVAAYIRSLL
jgi:uncharacterized SAM-binding protein YcdF (DUF218 family)